MHNRRHAPLHVKAKALLSTLSKSPSASKCLWSSLCSGTTFGTQASCNGRGIRACYLSAMLHTPFNDFAVIMNCLQGREVSTLNHLLIGQAGHLWIRNKESLGTFRTPEVLCSSTFFSQVLCHCLHSLVIHGVKCASSWGGANEVKQLQRVIYHDYCILIESFWESPWKLLHAEHY